MQGLYLNAWARCCQSTQVGNGIGFVLLNTHHGPFYLQGMHQNPDSCKNFRTFLEHQAVIAGQEGLTLYCVDDQNLTLLAGVECSFT
jgi:hypothetical protein